jgi:hypothetical protein
MSQDQRPARVRVVQQGPAPAGTPQRRRGDAPATGGAAGEPAAPAPALAARLIPSLLFLLGCAAGGAAAVLLDIWGAFLR